MAQAAMTKRSATIWAKRLRDQGCTVGEVAPVTSYPALQQNGWVSGYYFLARRVQDEHPTTICTRKQAKFFGF